MTTRSTVLAVRTLVDQVNVEIYTPPSGFVAIVKDVRWMSLTAMRAGSIGLSVQRGSDIVTFLAEQAPIQYKPEFWTGWIMLEQGDQLLGLASIQSATFWISGTELPAPPL